MGGLEMLDMAIGMVFLFTMVALSASTMRELIESWLKTRSIMIERGIREMLRDPKGEDIMKHLFAHPQISGLFMGSYDPKEHLTAPLFRTAYVSKKSVVMPTDEWRAPFRSHLPSYIPTRNFAIALLDFTARGPLDPENPGVMSTEPLSIEAIRAGIASLPNSTAQQAVLNAIDMGEQTVEGAIKAVGDWYDGCMERVTGWYKRQTQKILFFIGLFLAASLNIDSIAIMQRLSYDDAWRTAVVQKAVDADAGQPAPAPAANAPAGLPDPADAQKQVNALSAKLTENGYFSAPNPLFAETPDAKAIVKALLGWLITAFAAALGAPFWFDLLNKLVFARASLKPGAAPAAAPAAAAAPPDPGGPAARLVSSAADAGFVPHSWKGKNPQEGVL